SSLCRVESNSGSLASHSSRGSGKAEFDRRRPAAHAEGGVPGTPWHPVLDELPECKHHVLEVLRQPLEKRLTKVQSRVSPRPQSFGGAGRKGDELLGLSRTGSVVLTGQPPISPRQPFTRALCVGPGWPGTSPPFRALNSVQRNNDAA